MPPSDASVAITSDFDPLPLGHWIDGPQLPVTRDGLDAYADAVGAPPGARSAPLFSVVACYPILFAAVDLVTPEPVRGRMVHGEHDVSVHRLAAVGDLLTARARPVAVVPTTAGARVHVELEVHDQRGAAVATHRLTAVCRGVLPATGLGVAPELWPAGGMRGPEPTELLTVVVAADQPRRYADATGDHNAVHVDVDAARRAGFDGVIAHGLGVLGLVTSALGRGAGTGRVTRVRARFSVPVLPPATLTVRSASVARAEAGSAALSAFAVVDEHGAAVLRDGWLLSEPAAT